MELHQPAAGLVPPMDARLAVAHTVDVQVRRHEISTSFRRRCLAAEIPAPVRAPIPRREIQELFYLLAFHRRSPRVEIKCGATAPHGWSETDIARRVAQRRMFLDAVDIRRRDAWQWSYRIRK